MNVDKIIDAIGIIDDELIEEADIKLKKYFGAKKMFILIAALIIFTTFSVVSLAYGVFDNKIINIDVVNEANVENINIDKYILEFDVDIKEDAQETIEHYYLPMFLLNGKYNANANSYSGKLYWENPEKKQIIAYNQFSVLAYDEYSVSFKENTKPIKEKYVFEGEEIQCIVFISDEDNTSIKNLYWSDGYSIFHIMSFNCDEEILRNVIESIELVEDFSEYGKFKENVYH